MPTTESYEDGSYCIFNEDGSGGCWTADGYQTDAWDATAPFSAVPTAVPPSDQRIGIIESIGDVLSSIFGGGQHGYYAPNRGQQPQPSYRQSGNYPAGNYQPQAPCNGIMLGGGVGSSSAGLCVSKTMLLLGGAGLALFLFGQRRGRR